MAAESEFRLSLGLEAARGVRWRLADACWRPWAAAASELIRTQGVPPGATVLKQATNRLIVRLPRPDAAAGGPGSVVVKSFPTGHARLALFGRHRRYGPTELAHLELARQRDVPVPEVFGYAERRLWGLMVPNTAVMMEDLGDRRSVGDVLRGTSTDTEVTAALATAADLILRLHAAGCNHIDLNSGNLLLSRAGEDRGRVIDLMYARFHPAPSPNILCFMVAYFAGSVASVLPAARLEAWIAEVLSRSGAATELGQWRRLATNPQECRMSRRDRLALV